jgi:hypothetical protein
MKNGPQDPLGDATTGMLSGSDRGHEERNMELRKSGRVRVDVSAA